MSGQGDLRRRNTRTVLLSLGILAVMVTLTAYSVPLYRVFCQVTGYGGTTQRADAAPDLTDQRVVTVRFNADTNSGLPWSFRPVQREVKLRLGEQALAFFHARNLASAPVTGQAVYNVTPAKAGLYFNKIACFCFNEQTLAAGAEADMPVQFFIDPEMAKDRKLDDIKVITLSYTFFRAADDPGADKLN